MEWQGQQYRHLKDTEGTPATEQPHSQPQPICTQVSWKVTERQKAKNEKITAKVENHKALLVGTKGSAQDLYLKQGHNGKLWAQYPPVELDLATSASQDRSGQWRKLAS